MTYRSASHRARVFDDVLREAMQTPITQSHGVEVPPAADPAAGTDGAEADAAHRVATRSAIVDTDAHGPYSDGVQRRGAHQITSTPHRRAEVVRSDSADPEGWVNHSRPEARSGHAVTAASVTPTGSSVETWGSRLAATHETVGGVPGSAPAGQTDADREAVRQARLRLWQAER